MIHEGLSRKILIPVSTFFDRKSLARALSVLRILRTATIVLFHVVEVPRRTTPLDPNLWSEDIKKAESLLDGLAEWLKVEGYRVEKKVVTSRDASEGIVSEANNGEYDVVLMAKRRIRRGWTRIFHRSISEEVIRDANPIVLTFLAEQELAERKV